MALTKIKSGGLSDDLTIEFDSLSGTGAVAVTNILDEDNLVSNSATALATQQSIKAYVDTTVGATNEVVEDTTPQLGGDLDLNSNDITGTGNINVTGVVTANAGVVVDNFTLDGTTLALSSGNFTLDVAGDIILDADGDDIRFQEGGAEWLKLRSGSTGPQLISTVSDHDMSFKGTDNNTLITALTLDMSAAGAATFNAGVTTTDINLGTSTGQKLLMYANSNIKYGMSIETSEYRMFAEDQAVLTFGHMARSNGTTYTERMRIDSSGRVEVKGGQELRVYRGDNATYGSMKYLTGSGGLQFNDQNNDGISFVRAGSTESMRLNSTGLGIGTASPSAKLHVEGDGSYITQRGYGQILDLGNWTNGLVRIESTGAPLYIAAAGAHYMDFATNGVGRLRISSSGNVSIGADLTVGNSYLSSNYAQFANMRVNNNAYIGSENTPSAVQIQSGGAVAFGYAISAPSAQFTPSSGETVVINRDGAGPYFGTSSNHTLRLITNNTERLRINSAGVVTMPYQAYANASSNGTISATNAIPLNQNNRSRGGLTISGNRMTAPVAGAYVMGYHHLGNNSGACQIAIKVNGNILGGSRTQDTASANDSFGTQIIQELGANDYIEFWVISGASHGNPSYNSMWAFLIG